MDSRLVNRSVRTQNVKMKLSRIIVEQASPAETKTTYSSGLKRGDVGVK